MVSFNTLKLCTELGCKVGKAKPPKINFGAVSKPIEQATPSFKIGTPTRIEQATCEMTGATQLAEQNRAFIIGNKKTISNYSPVNNTKGFTLGSARKTERFIAEAIPYNKDRADVTLTCRSGSASFEGDSSFLRNLKGYTDNNGEILPYIFVDIPEVFNKGNGLGRAIMEDIKQIARERCGGRLLLLPYNAYRNPSPFYYKCGLRPTTQEASKELSAYFQNGTPFKSGGSPMMYLPIE